MSERSSLHPGERGQGLFSPAEIEELMRIEFDRAERHTYALVCMVIAVDRLGQLQDLYGFDSRDEILRAVVGTLRESLRDSDLLGALHGDRMLAVFPHTTGETGGLMARRLLDRARRLRFGRDGRTLRITLSIGIAHNGHKNATSFETLLGVAEEGLVVADAAGGDRFVETELYQLYEKRRKAQLARHAAAAEEAARPAPAPTVAPGIGALERAVIELLTRRGIGVEGLESLNADTIALALRALQESKQAPSKAAASALASGAAEEKDRQIETLERRLAKLSHALGVTEEELKRVATMKGLDFGVASIYRSVQGLSDEEGQLEQKRAMMKLIFEANAEHAKKSSPQREV